MINMPLLISLNLQNAVLSSLPFLCNWLFSMFYSTCLDKAMAKNKISRTNGRKLSQAIGTYAKYLNVTNIILI